jgi:hypothetical protein
MRFGLWLAAALCTAPAVLGQGVIEWSAQRHLSKDDFKGRVPPTAARTSLSWLHIDVDWQCANGRLQAQARATFDPSRSWWRPGQGNIWEGIPERTSGVSRTHLEARRSVAQRDLQLLEHEQLHFDIAEIAARRIRTRFEEMKGGCPEPGASAELQAYVAGVDRDLQEEQRRFDEETDHGTNAALQESWRRRIRQQLGLPGR